MVGKVDRIPYPVEDPGSWAQQASAREPSFLSFNKSSRLRKKREDGAKLDFAETRVSPSPFSQRRRTVWSVWSWSWNLQIRSGHQMAIFQISVPLGRRSPLVDPATTLPRPSEPVTRFPAPQHYVLLRPMRSPRGSVSPTSRASRGVEGGQLSSRTWNLEAWPHPPSGMRRCTTENRADGCNDGWPYAVSFVAAQDTATAPAGHAEANTLHG